MKTLLDCYNEKLNKDQNALRYNRPLDNSSYTLLYEMEGPIYLYDGRKLFYDSKCGSFYDPKLNMHVGVDENLLLNSEETSILLEEGRKKDKNVAEITSQISLIKKKLLKAKSKLNSEYEKRLKSIQNAAKGDKGRSAENKLYNQLKRKFDVSGLEDALLDAQARLKTAQAIANPSAPDFKKIVGGKTFGKIESTHHNFDIFNKLSESGKELYEMLRVAGNNGEEIEKFQKRFYEIKPKELATILMLVIDMGYSLNRTLLFILGEASPKLEKYVSDYEGSRMNRTDFLNAKHPFYKSVFQRYLNIYDGDERRSALFTKMFFNHKKLENK